MNAIEEPSYLAFARANVRDGLLSTTSVVRGLLERIDRDAAALKAAKPRTINSPYELDALPFGSAVQTSDTADTVVLKCEGGYFRNQSGAEIDVPTLWRYGTRPFVVIYEPGATA